jgi:hypothetical protein
MLSLLRARRLPPTPFSVFVEAINLRVRAKTGAVRLRRRLD